MRFNRRIAALAGIAVSTSVFGACSRADLDVITHLPSPDGGADSAGPITCPSPALQPGDMVRTLQSAGVSRSYVLHVPPTYAGSSPVPLVLDFHGLASSGAQERNLSRYPAVTDQDGAIMAFPTGLVGPSGAAWNLGPCCVASVDDVAFARAVVADASNVACVDPRRVYAVGFSIGGGMAYHIACHAADVFAAVAPSSFDLLEENVGDCQPARPITVVSFRGSADGLVPYDGGYSAVVPGMPVTFLGAQATFGRWAEIDGCAGTPSAPDSSGCSTYSDCQGGVEVILCTNEGAGQAQGNAAIAWPVLQRHPLP